MVAIVMISSPFNVHAAQDARVLSDGLIIYENPNDDSDVIENGYHGELLRIGTEHKEDFWYKVRVPLRGNGKKPKYGWIKKDQVELNAYRGDHLTRGIQAFTTVVRHPEIHRFVFGFYYGIPFMSPTPFIITTGAAVTTVQSTGVTMSMIGGEVGYRLSTSWTVSLHYHQHSMLNTYITDLGNASYSVNGNLLTVGLEYALIHKLPWKLALAGAVGGSLGSTITATLGNQLVNFDIGRVPAATLKLIGKWHPFKNLALFVSAGYRYKTKKDIVAGTSTLDLVLNAPFVDAGLQVEF